MSQAVFDTAERLVASGVFETYIGWLEEQQLKFRELLENARSILERSGVSFPAPEDGKKLTPLKFKTPLGSIVMDFTFVIDKEEEVCVAAVFTDYQPWLGGDARRLLYTAFLGSHGNWVGDDGESLASNGRLVPASVVTAIRSALARKLAFETELLRPPGVVI